MVPFLYLQQKADKIRRPHRGHQAVRFLPEAPPSPPHSWDSGPVLTPPPAQIDLALVESHFDVVRPNIENETWKVSKSVRGGPQPAKINLSALLPCFLSYFGSLFPSKIHEQINANIDTEKVREFNEKL